MHSVASVVFHLCRNNFHESVKQIGSAQHQGNAGGLGTYETVQHFNDIKEHLHMVKRDVEHLVQRSAQVSIRTSRSATGTDQKSADRALCPPQNPAEKAMKCPELPSMPSCLSTVHFIIFIVIQSVLFFCYIMYK